MRPSHDDYYLEMLKLVASRSTCARRAVGAIIVDEQHRVLSTGYNGVPVRFNHCTEDPCPGANDPAGDTSRCYAVHAEVNALLQCPRINDAWKMYVSCTPCFSCAKMIANTSISHITCLEKYADPLGEALLACKGVTISVRK